jgi:hypothetical protein
MSTSVKYGTLVASCGSEGLFAAYDDFGVIGQDRPPLEQAGNASSRASWISYSLTNYSSATSLQFLSGYKQNVNTSRPNEEEVTEVEVFSGLTVPIGDFASEQERTVVTRLQEDARSSEQLAADAEGADFVSNSFDYFFVHLPNSEYKLYTRRHRSGRIVGSRGHETAGEVDKVLSTHTFHNGIIVESFNGVYLITASGASKVYDGAALKVRTFPSGKYGFNVIAVIDEEGLNLISPFQ